MKKSKIIFFTMLLFISSLAILSSDIEYGSASLNKFRSYFELKEFIEKSKSSYFEYYWGLESKSVNPLRGAQSYSEGSFSRTNIQVEGVDEADYVKTDGEYIYVISGQKVIIVKAYPAEETAILSKISVNGTLKQLFLNADRLVTFYENASAGNYKTLVRTYDVCNKSSPMLKNEIVVDGRYFTSRMVGDYIYIIARKSAALVDGEVALPKIYSNEETKTTVATDIYYSGTIDYGYMFTTIVTMNIFEDSPEPKDQTILTGWTTTVYVSLNNVYLAIGQQGQTELHRIQIENGEITYANDGHVSGTVLNQFSMDEHEGYFRIATTLHSQRNSLYILDMNLETVSSIENIAPGESIHSVRFMGNKCYLVTFKKTDPFFVIDLSNPLNPQILGELKISGYSDYLHLYDANHVIGIGKETIEGEGGSFAWYQGVKISLFDVTNVSAPKELAKYEIGDRGTDSPVLSDHKAFLFDKEKNLLVIPVTVAKIDESQYSGNIPPYAFGQVVGQGAFIFHVSLESEEKIVLRGNITHIENSNVYDTRYCITRTLYIGDVLYTISTCKIKINSLLDLSEINELSLSD